MQWRVAQEESSLSMLRMCAILVLQVTIPLSSLILYLGFYCPGGNVHDTVPPSIYECQTGQHSPAAASSCSTCTAGYKCPNTYDAPIACEFGTYSLAGYV